MPKTGIHLYNVDCVEGMASSIEDESVDIVVTSPPYNLGIKYNSYNDSKKWHEYLLWTVEWARMVRLTMKDDASLFLNLGASPSSPMLPHMIISQLVDKEEVFHLQNTIHWVKSIAIPDKETGTEVQRGHYKPINSNRFLNDCHEYVFHLTPNARTLIERTAIGVPYADKTNIKRWKHTNKEDLKCRGNTWFIPYKTISNRAKDRPHPATFPTELAVKCIKLHGDNNNAVVMDPFLGIGHAALAALECHVSDFIGFEIDDEYMRVAHDEISSYVKLAEKAI